MTVQSFTQDWEKLLGKEGPQGRGVPATPILKQPSFDGEIGQEENQEPYPKRLAHTEEWAYDVVQSRFTPLKEWVKKAVFVCWVSFNQVCQRRAEAEAIL